VGSKNPQRQVRAQPRGLLSDGNTISQPTHEPSFLGIARHSPAVSRVSSSKLATQSNDSRSKRNGPRPSSIHAPALDQYQSSGLWQSPARTGLSWIYLTNSNAASREATF